MSTWMTSLPTEKHHKLAKLRAQHFCSLLGFTRVFYRARTGREFILSSPVGRESHFLAITKALERVMRGECRRLIINVPPRYGKTELLIHFVAWALARYPDSNFLYVSYSLELAKKQTQTIRDIINLPEFSSLFGVKLADDTTAKSNFHLSAGGSVYAAGAGGTITGRGAGIKGINRFGGAFLMDDMLKPDESHSDTIREGVNEWFWNTAHSRINTPNTPFIYIGQRTHEHDLPAMLLETGEWEVVSLPAIDSANNALYPEMHDINTLLKMKEDSPYNFASQYQQDPQPAGGGIFKPEWFVLHEYEPNIIYTFITADTAETDKTHNDATVFSFFGIYEIENNGIKTGIYGLHWLDCLEIRIEPKDLQDKFMAFYSTCMGHKIKPRMAAIERKSTGVTLCSVLQGFQGLEIREIVPNKSDGSKVKRFLDIQQYVASKRISLPHYSRHTQICIDHCKKITANGSHRFDDIADTLYFGIKLGLIDQVVLKRAAASNSDQTKRIGSIINTNLHARQKLRDVQWK